MDFKALLAALEAVFKSDNATIIVPQIQAAITAYKSNMTLVNAEAQLLKLSASLIADLPQIVQDEKLALLNFVQTKLTSIAALHTAPTA